MQWLKFFGDNVVPIFIVIGVVAIVIGVVKMFVMTEKLEDPSATTVSSLASNTTNSVTPDSLIGNPAVPVVPGNPATPGPAAADSLANVQPYTPPDCEPAAAVPDQAGYTGDLLPEDLLPKSQVSDQFQQNFPAGVGDIASKNFLTAGYNMGIDTVSSSLKNANLQLRTDPYIPRTDVGIWNQSSILPSDPNNRRTFEIGSSTC